MSCVNRSSKEFKFLAEHNDLSINALELITHKYWIENKTEDYFPSDVYIQAQLGKIPYEEPSKTVRELWEMKYKDPQEYTSLETLEDARREALRYFPEEAVTYHRNFKDNYVLVVRKPLARMSLSISSLTGRETYDGQEQADFNLIVKNLSKEQGKNITVDIAKENLTSNPLKRQYRGKLIYAQAGTGKSTIANNIDVFDSDFLLGQVLGVSPETAGFFFKTLNSQQKTAFGEKYRELIRQKIAEGKTVLTANASMLNEADVVMYNDTAELTDKRVNAKDRAINNQYSALDYHKDTLNQIRQLKENEKDKEYIELDKDHYIGDYLLTNPVDINSKSLEGTDRAGSRGVEDQQTLINNFLSAFDITVNHLDGYNSKLPLFDALNRTINAQSPEEITEGVGYAIAFMMQSDPEMQKIIMQSHGLEGTYTTKVRDPRKAFKVRTSMGQMTRMLLHKEDVIKETGKQITEELRKHFGEDIDKVKTENKSIWNIIKSFFNRLNWALFRSIAAKGDVSKASRLRQDALAKEGLFVADIVDALGRGDFSRIKGPMVKPGTMEKAQRVVIGKALKENPFEDGIIRKLGSKGISLAGSASIAVEGTLFRPLENPLHDIDFNAGDNSSRKTVDKAMGELFEEGTWSHSTSIVNPLNPKNSTQTYVLLNVPFITKNVRDKGFYAEYYSPDGKYLGKRVKSELHLENGVQGKLLDFFVGPKAASKHGTHFEDFNGHRYLFSNSNAAMAAKILWARPKDMWDYKNFKRERETQDNFDELQMSVSSPQTFTFKDGTTVRAPFKPNYQQEDALNAMDEFINSNRTSMTLSGFAGTGKTSLMEMLAEKMRKQYKPVMFCASTNKAAAVLKERVSKSGFEAQTLNKVFGITVEVDPNKSYNARNLVNKLKDVDILYGTTVIIDEASMINEENYAILNSIAQRNGLKIIYVGDAAQLAPVNETKISKVFRDQSHEVRTLSIVERTGDNAILKEATDLRDGKALSGESSFNSKGQGVAYLKPSSTQEREAVIRRFIPELKNNPNYFRILAYTNAAVAAYNTKVRQLLGYNDNIPRVGEPITGYANWGYIWDRNGGKYRFINSEAYKVIKVGSPKNAHISLPDGSTVTMQAIPITLENSLGEKDTFNLMDIKGNQENRRIATQLANVKSQLWNQARGLFGRAKALILQQINAIDEFLFVNDNITDGERTLQAKIFDFGYAMTVHKSQGSTFTHVLMDDVDISKAKDERSTDMGLEDIPLTWDDTVTDEPVTYEVAGPMEDIDMGDWEDETPSAEGTLIQEAPKAENPNVANIRQQLKYVAVSRATDTVTIISDNVKKEDTPLNHINEAPASQEATQQKPVEQMSSAEVWRYMAARQPLTKRSQITYTPKGQEKQTYTVENGHIYNKEGKEVYPEDTVHKTHRNKILANYAVQEGLAVVVKHPTSGEDYVVDNNQQITSVRTGKIMEWGEENGDRRRILAQAEKEFRERITSTKERGNTLNEQMLDQLKLIGLDLHYEDEMAQYLREHGNKAIQQAIAEQQEMQDIKARAQANGTFMKAPNGNDTNLTERQWLQVRTKAFKKWFGDWVNEPANASKVVDENGEPLVVYHFTDENTLNKFANDREAYFTSDESGEFIFEPYKNNRKNKIACFLNIKSPVGSDNAYFRDYNTGNILPERINDTTRLYRENQIENIKKLQENYSNVDGIVRDYNFGIADKTFRKREGYTNVEFITFNPNQIKSATDNNGMFSTENDDIQMFIGKKTRAQFEQSLKKARPDMSEAEIKSTLDFLHSLEDNKENTAYIKTAIRWITNRSLTLPQDHEKAYQAFELARKKHLDLQKYNTLGELITSPEMQPKKKEKAEFNPDEAKTFSNKRTVTTKGGRVFTVYDVENTEEGQREVCKALAAHYEMSPWCLSTFTATGEPTQSAKHYWNLYKALPRKIAYENGKPVAFNSDKYGKGVAETLFRGTPIITSGEESIIDSAERGKLSRGTIDAWKQEGLVTESKIVPNALRLTEKAKKEIYDTTGEAWWDMEDTHPQDSLSDSIVSEPKKQPIIEEEDPAMAEYLHQEHLQQEQQVYHNMMEAWDRMTPEEREQEEDNWQEIDLPWFLTPEGEIRGFATPEGSLYFDRTVMSPEHAVHEYTHLWDRVVAKNNPELWHRGVTLMKKISLWKEIENDENYGKKWKALKGMTSEKLESFIASEVHSRLTGVNGEQILDRLSKEKGQKGIIGRLKQWLLDFWKDLKGTFSNWSQEDLDELTLQDFTMMTIRDLADGFNPNTFQQNTQQATQQSTFDTSKAEFYSGAADGSDKAWGAEAKAFGISVKDYTGNDYRILSQEWKNKIEKEYTEARQFLGKPTIPIKNASSNMDPGVLTRRDMMQADKADAVFAVIEGVTKPGEVEDYKGKKYPNNTGHDNVKGGTANAVARGIIRGIPVYVFDQSDNQWKVWDRSSNTFIPTSEPTLTPHAATIGTRGINDSGRQAIKSILTKTLSQQDASKQPAQEEPLDTSAIFQNPSSTEVTVEDKMKPWRSDPSKQNISRRIYLKGHKDKGYFEVVKDFEDGYYSIHFKPTDSDNPNAFSKDEKEVLFRAVADTIPVDGKLSTWGELSRGGIAGLERFSKLGFAQSGERTVRMKGTGEEVTIPVFTKYPDTTARISLKGYEYFTDASEDTLVDAPWKIPFLQELDRQFSTENPEGRNEEILQQMKDILDAKSFEEWQNNTDSETKEKVQKNLDEYDQLITQLNNLLDSNIITASEVRHVAELVVNAISDNITQLQKEKGLAEQQFPTLNSKLDFQTASRKDIITAIGINKLVYRAKLLFDPEANEYEDLDTIEQADLIIDNWDAIMTLASDIFAANEGIGISRDFDNGGWRSVEGQKIDFDNFNNYENDPDAMAEETKDEQEHWQIEQRTIDILNSMSAMVRLALHECYQVDKEGNVIKSKWGIPERVNARNAVNSILRWTQGSLSLEDMIAKLSAKQGQHPWLGQLIERLNDKTGNETDFQSQFYGVFAKHFQLYSVVLLEDGKYHSMTVNSHPALTEAMQTVTTQFKVGEHPLFTQNGINMKLLGTENTTGKNAEFNLHKALAEMRLLSDRIAHGEDVDADMAETATNNIMGVCRVLGYPVAENMISEIINSDNILYLTEKLGFIVDNLDKAAKAGKKDYDPFAYKKENSIGGSLRNFLTPITDQLEDTATNAFYDSGKMYQSYVTPSFMTKLLQKFRLEGQDFEDFLDSEYGNSEWFKFKGRNGAWRNEWLRMLATNEEARKIFDHKVELNFNKHNYMRNMTDAEYTLSLFAEYFAEGINDKQAMVPAWFRIPMQSNKPSSEFIKFYSYRGADYKNDIRDGLYNMFLQELSRIQTVRMRNLPKNHPSFIKNFDKNGKMFNFLPFFNSYLEDTTAAKKGRNLLDTTDSVDENTDFARILQKKLRGDELTSDEEANLMKYAKKAIYNHMDRRAQEILNRWEQEGILEAAKQVEGVGKEDADVRNSIENYLWNDAFAAKNILQLTVGDIAFYKDAEDLQKRLAQLHAPGIRGNVAATDYQGNRVSDGYYRTFILQDFDTFRSNIIANITEVFDRKIARAPKSQKAQLEALKDSLVRPPKTNGPDDKGGKYWNINVTDAQGYSSPSSYRKKAFIFGKWSHKAEDIYQKLLSGEYNYTDLEVAFQPLKPFVYTHLEKHIGDGTPIETMNVPFQAKNSEYLLIMADAIMQSEVKESGELSRPNLLRAIYRVMEDSKRLNPTKGIDTVQFESAIKSGLQGKINIYQFAEDAGGESLAYNEMMSQIYQNYDRNKPLEEQQLQYNTDTFVHEASFEDYCLQQEVPEHFKDHSQAHGSQIRMITPSDLDLYKDPNGNPNDENNINYYEWTEPDGTKRKVRADEFKKEYEQTIADNIAESIENLSKELHLDSLDKKERNIALSKILLREILSSPRYGVDLAQACAVDKATGEFRIPKGDPIQAKRIEQLINSIIKNRVNKQKIAGGPIVQVTNFGTSKQLHIRFKDNSGKILLTEEEFNNKLKGEAVRIIYKDYKEYLQKEQHGIAYFEVFIPIWANEIFEKFANEDGTIDVKAIEAVDPDLLKMISYRIPTEDKYSCAPMKVVGFMPREAGDAIMLPWELTEIDDSDFDVDKRYVMRKDIKIKENKPAIEKLLIKRVSESYAKAHNGKVNRKFIIDQVKMYMDNPDRMKTADALMASIHREKQLIMKQHKDKVYKTVKPTSGRTYRDNKIVDMTWAVLTNEMTADKILNPGGFDNFKRVGYMAAAYRLKSHEMSWSQLEEKTTDELNDLCYVDKDLTWADTQIQFYKQNAAAASLIGVFAVNKVAHATLEGDDIFLAVDEVCGEEPFYIAGMQFSGRMQVDPKYDREGNLIGKTLGSGVSASADAAKTPVLNLLNINMTTVGTFTSLLRLGMPHEDACMFIGQDVIARMLDDFNRQNLTGYASLNSVITKEINRLREKHGITEDSAIDKEPLTKEELIEGLTPDEHEVIDYKVLIAFQKAKAIADSIRKLSFPTRFNSISSAVGPLIIDNLILEHKMEQFMDENADTHFYTAGGQNVDITDVFADHPILNQFSRTVDIARQMTSDMPAGSTGFRNMLAQLPEDIKEKIYNDKKMFSKLSDFYQSYLAIASGLVNPANLKNYIDGFPKWFMKQDFKEKYPDNALIQAIQMTVSKKTGRAFLSIKLTGEDETVKETYRNAWIDLHKTNPELSQQLFEYCFFRAGIGFSPKTFMAVVPTYVKERLQRELPNGEKATYLDTYRRFPSIPNEVMIDQFVANNWEDNKLVPKKGGKSSHFTIKGSELYATTQEDIQDLEGASYIKVYHKGETRLYKLVSSSEDGMHYTELKPLGNNGEYLEMDLVRITTPMSKTTQTSENNDASEIKTTSTSETDATEEKQGPLTTENKRAKAIAALARDYMNYNEVAYDRRIKESKANAQAEDMVNHPERYGSLMQSILKAKGINMSKDDAIKKLKDLDLC